jgi:phosphoglycolate phosphatase
MSTTTAIAKPQLLIFDWCGTLANNSGTLFAGVWQTLSLLHKSNFKLALATSMFREQIFALLEENNLQDMFFAVQTSDMGYQKPDPRMLQEILEITGCLAVDTIMIGDTVVDLLMANRAAIPAIAVLSGNDNKTNLAREQPFAIIENVNDLPNLLKVTDAA